MDELKELSRPIIEYLKEKHNPYMTVLIIEEKVVLYQTEASIPTDRMRDDLI